MIGQTISHYKILEKLGEGGMGIVYKAQDITLGRTVAIKVLPSSLVTDENVKARFLQEAKAASSLNHPNITTVYEMDEAGGQSFIVTEYLEGETLKERIKKSELKIKDVVQIVIQIAEGLSAAHQKGIVHRDIKSENIMVTKSGVVKIMDFGLAKLKGMSALTKTGRTVGTLAYMSPEQLLGKEIDHRSDIFSFGVVLYEILAGELPFKGEYEAAVMYTIIHEQPKLIAEKRKDVPENLTALVQKALEKNPEDRYQDVKTMIADLQPIMKSLESGEALPLIARVVKKKIRISSKRVRIAVGAAMVMIVLALFLIPPVRNALEKWLAFGSVPAEKHLVVLPFTNVGNDPTNQAFCDGLMETLTSKLTQLQLSQRSLWVVDANEVRKQKVSTATEAQRAFNITLAVSGSVQREKNRIRLTVNLVDPKTLRQLKSFVTDQQLTTLSGLQDEVVMKMAEMLGVQVPPQTLRALTAGGTLVSQASDFYIQGRGYLSRFERIENINIAIGLFERAVKEDSTFALAYAGLGEAYWRKYDATKDKQWIDYAVKNVEKAIKLNDQLAPGHITMGMIQKGTGNSEFAVAEFRRALELDSLSADGYRELADAYVRQGNFISAELTFKKAIEMKPSYWAGYNDLGAFYYRQKRYDEAIIQFKRVIELTPDNARGYSSLGASYFAAGRGPQAINSLEKSVNIEPTYIGFSNLATLYFYEKAYADMARMYEKALDLNDRDYRVWGNLASAYYWLGQRGKALEKFQQAVKLADEQLKINPRDVTVLSQLADYHSLLGNKNEALNFIKQALKIAPDAVDVIKRSAEVYEQLGQRNEALRQIELALKKGTSVQELERAPALKELRSDPRYQSLVERLGRKP